jgi:anion-transporting  ArsA/GET3 family ATPase
LPPIAPACYTAALPGLGHIVDGRAIVLCVGSGGVGKTTTAAAIALEAARRGRRTLVLTIDPAKRLATSLGLGSLGHDAQRVPDALVVGPGGDEVGSHLEGMVPGELWAMMLDQKRAFDDVVARHASDPAAVKRIMANPVYAQISGSLAGAQEYAALATLHELDATKAWDLIVVDTPPTAHALDFLDAPEKLTMAIDSPAIEWFRKLRGGSKGWSMVGASGTYVLKRLARFVGTRFLEDLALFFTEFNDILGGFRQRAEATFALLRQQRVGFLVVSSPEPMALEEALAFHRRLIGSAMPFAGFVVNKVHRARPIALAPAELPDAIAAAPAVAALGLQPGSVRIAAEALVTAHGELEILAAADRAAIARLVAAAGGQPVVEVPFFDQDIHDIERLATLRSHLFA